MSKKAKISHPSPISNFSRSKKISPDKDSKNREMERGKYLGIDFGQSKIGLAIADAETRIAFAYGVLRNDRDLLKKIAEIAEKEGIGKIIIGSQMEVRPPFGGRTSKSSETSEVFRQMLAKKIKSIKIEFQNELFSTQMAERNLIEKGVKRIKRYDDQEAARIILQSWLDKKR